MTRIHLRDVMAALSAVLYVLVAFGAPPADAASYTVWSCRGPDGAPTSTAAWETITDGSATSDGCAAGGSLNASLLQSDDGPGRLRGYRFVVPPGARVSGYRIHLFAATANAATSDAFQAGIDDNPEPVNDVDSGCPTVNCSFGVVDPPLDTANLLAIDGLNLGDLRIATVCNKQQPLGCYTGGNDTLAEVRVYRTQVDVRDDDAPVILERSGMPADGSTVSANALVTFDASDAGGGVQTLALLVDGNEVAHQDAGGSCLQPFARPAPCPAQLTAALPLPVTALGPGPHSAQVRAVDAAGNVTTSPPVSFTVAAPAPVIVERLVAAPSTAPRPVTIRPTRERITLPARSQGISGIVQDAAGGLLAGVQVTVRSRPFGVRRSRLRLERTVTTDAFGRFDAPAGSASRLIVLDVNDSAHRAVEPVEISLLQRLRVGILTRDSSLRNGSTLLLRASIAGAGSGARDKVVLVQAFVEGRWTTVDSLSAGSDGRALWRYRFRATTRRTGYRFRLRVERSGDVWPWPTTTSRVLRVKVSP